MGEWEETIAAKRAEVAAAKADWDFMKKGIRKTEKKLEFKVGVEKEIL